MKKNLLSSFLTILLFIGSCQLSAQTVSPLMYSETISSTVANVYFKKVVAAPHKGCLVSFLNGNNAGVLLRVDSVGNFLWNKVSGNNTYYADIIPSLDSTFYTASSDFIYPQNAGVVVSRLNDHGAELWSQKLTFNAGQDTIFPTSLAATLDSGLVLCGSDRLHTLGTFVARYSRNGSLLWSRRFQSGNGTSNFTSIRQTSDTGYVLSGLINTPSLLKLDKNGTLTWAKSYTDNNGPFYATDLAVKKDRIFLGSAETAVTLLETDLSGTAIRAQSFGTSHFIQNVSLKMGITADKGAYMTISDPYSSVFLKLDSTGTEQWNSSSSMASGGGTQLTDKRYVFAGNGPLITVRLADFYYYAVLSKLDSSGNTAQNGYCPFRAAGSTNTLNFSPTSLAVTSSTNLNASSQPFSVSTHSEVFNSTPGCLTDPGVGFKTYSYLTTVAVFPNPSSGNFLVEWQSLPDEAVTYSLFNLSGSLVKEERSTGELRHHLSCDGMPLSVYILKISVHGQTVRNERLIIAP